MDMFNDAYTPLWLVVLTGGGVGGGGGGGVVVDGGVGCGGMGDGGGGWRGGGWMAGAGGLTVCVCVGGIHAYTKLCGKLTQMQKRNMIW